jgi:predicted nucleic acid-binding protein
VSHVRRVLIDSSAFLSLEDSDERAHEKTRAALRELEKARAQFVTTNFVFDETYTLLLVRLGQARAVQWGTRFREGELVEVIRVTEDHEQRAWDIICEFDDKDFSFTDATSFAVSESLAIEEALAVDRHFHQVGRFQVLP